MNTQIDSIDYPAVTALPEYVAEADKLSVFVSRLQTAEAEKVALLQMRDATLENKAEEHAGLDAISIAELALAGTKPQNFAEDIQEKQLLIDTLKRAVTVQQLAVRRVVSELSVKAAARFQIQHKAITQRLIDAVDALTKANHEEQRLRNSIEALGYGVQLPPMVFCPEGCQLNAQDPYGGYTQSWWKSACAYASTELSFGQMMEVESQAQADRVNAQIHLKEKEASDKAAAKAKARLEKLERQTRAGMSA